MSRLSAVMRSLSRDELVLRMSAVMLMVHGAQSEVLAALLTVIGARGRLPQAPPFVALVGLPG